MVTPRVMRLPFSSRNKGQEGNVESTQSSSRRSSVSDDTGSRRDGQGAHDDFLSERSNAPNPTPTDTPATSFSSYGSANGYNGEKSGMYKLSGKQLYFLKGNKADWFSC